MSEEAVRRLLPRPLRRAVARGSGYAILDGVRIPLDAAVVSPNMLKAIAHGTYERSESRLLRRTLRPDDRVLELGGGIGFISALAAQLVPDGHVTVLEANPALVPLIEATHAANRTSARVINAVVADVSEVEAHGRTMAFHQRADFWASSLDAARPGILSTVDVPVVSLASLLADVRPSVLVFDIEGGEAPLFEAADLPGVRAVIGEFHPDVLGLDATNRIVRNFLRQGLALDTGQAQPNNLLFVRIEEHGVAAG